MKLTKYLCHILTIKGTSLMMKFIRWLTFIKIVLQVVKRLKKIVIRKRRLKKILIKKERLKKIAKNIHVSNKMNSNEFRSSRQFQAF